MNNENEHLQPAKHSSKYPNQIQLFECNNQIRFMYCVHFWVTCCFDVLVLYLTWRKFSISVNWYDKRYVLYKHQSNTILCKTWDGLFIRVDVVVVYLWFKMIKLDYEDIENVLFLIENLLSKKISAIYAAIMY